MSVLLPALVYPTSEIVGTSSRLATSRSFGAWILASLALSSWIRCATKRRSSSSCFSPGPRTPMPPL